MILANRDTHIQGFQGGHNWSLITFCTFLTEFNELGTLLLHLKKYFWCFVLTHISLSVVIWKFAVEPCFSMGSEQGKWNVWPGPWENANSECLFSIWTEIWAVQRFCPRQLCAYFSHCWACSELPDRPLIIDAKGQCSLSKSCRERRAKKVWSVCPHPKHRIAAGYWQRLKNTHLSCLLHPEYNPNVYQEESSFFILAKSGNPCVTVFRNIKGGLYEKISANYHVQGAHCCATVWFKLCRDKLKFAFVLLPA